jgi:hypothetical protein
MRKRNRPFSTPKAVGPTAGASTEGECKCLDTRRKEFNPEDAILHAAFLPDQLVQAAFGYGAVAFRVGVFAVIFAGRFAV